MHNSSATGPLIGSLCSGYGGLDLGVQAALGGTLAWHAEINRDAARILARHWPGVPNLGDITAINWALVPRVCVLTAGFPCQRRLGRRPPGRTQRPHPIRAVAARRPCGRSPPALPGGHRECPRTPHLARRFPWRRGTLPVVSGKRANPASSASTWCRTRLPGRPRVRRAVDRASRSDVGAPHRRERIFLTAWPAADPAQDPDQQPRHERRLPAPVEAEDRRPRSEPGRRGGVAAAPDAEGVRRDQGLAEPAARQRRLDPAERGGLPPASSAGGRHQGGWRPTWNEPDLVPLADGPASVGGTEPAGRAPAWRWGAYGPAISRWETLTRPAPAPTDAAGRLRADFVEWMQGLAPGWVTATQGSAGPLNSPHSATALSLSRQPGPCSRSHRLSPDALGAPLP